MQQEREGLKRTNQSPGNISQAIGRWTSETKPTGKAVQAATFIRQRCYSWPAWEQSGTAGQHITSHNAHKHLQNLERKSRKRHICTTGKFRLIFNLKISSIYFLPKLHIPPPPRQKNFKVECLQHSNSFQRQLRCTLVNMTIIEQARAGKWKSGEVISEQQHVMNEQFISFTDEWVGKAPRRKEKKSVLLSTTLCVRLIKKKIK